MRMKMVAELSLQLRLPDPSCSWVPTASRHHNTAVHGVPGVVRNQADLLLVIPARAGLLSEIGKTFPKNKLPLISCRIPRRVHDALKRTSLPRTGQGQTTKKLEDILGHLAEFGKATERGLLGISSSGAHHNPVQDEKAVAECNSQRPRSAVRRSWRRWTGLPVGPSVWP